MLVGIQSARAEAKGRIYLFKYKRAGSALSPNISTYVWSILVNTGE